MHSELAHITWETVDLLKTLDDIFNSKLLYSSWLFTLTLLESFRFVSYKCFGMMWKNACILVLELYELHANLGFVLMYNYLCFQMRWRLPTFLLLCVSIVYGEDTDMNDSAHIVASKFTLSQYAVEGMDYVIDYRLYNVGDRVRNIRCYIYSIH